MISIEAVYNVTPKVSLASGSTRLLEERISEALARFSSDISLELVHVEVRSAGVQENLW